MHFPQKEIITLRNRQLNLCYSGKNVNVHSVDTSTLPSPELLHCDSDHPFWVSSSTVLLSVQTLLRYADRQ